MQRRNTVNTRILTALATASFWALALSGCGSAEPDEATAAHQQAVGVRPVNEVGQPLNPTTLQPADDYPLGYCTHVCVLSKRWMAMTNQCKGVGVCDPDLATQECAQEWTKPVIGDGACVRELKRSCVNPTLPAP